MVLGTSTYLSLVTSKKLRSVHTGGDEFRSGTGVSSPAHAEIFIALARVARNPFLSDRSRYLMDGRQERVLVSTHALVATDGVRFRIISGAAVEAIYEKPDHQTSSLVSLEQSRKVAVITVDRLPL
jgi:hypothetical protein